MKFKEGEIVRFKEGEAHTVLGFVHIVIEKKDELLTTVEAQLKDEQLHIDENSRVFYYKEEFYEKIDGDHVENIKTVLEDIGVSY